MVRATSSQIPPELVALIYGAAANPARWPEAVAQLTHWTGGDVGALCARRLGSSSETVRITGGVDPKHRRAYVAHMRTEEPFPAQLVGLPVGRAMLLRDILGEDPLDPNSYCHQLMKSQNLKHVQCVLSHRTQSWLVSFATARRAGRDFDRHTLARLDVVAGHIGAALTPGSTLDSMAKIHEPGLRLVEQMGLAGVFQIDRTGHVLHGDAPSKQVSFAHPTIHVDQRRLRARAVKDQKRLARSLAHAVRGRSSMLVLGKGESALSLGLAPGPRRSPICAERSATVIFAPNQLRPSPLGAVRFETLSPSLRAVAELLVQGLTDKEIAASLNLPNATARTYVARVMKRLEVRSRRELMRRAGPN